MEKLNKNIKGEELSIFLLEERIKIINMDIERIDNILDKYGNYKSLKIKSLTTEFNKLLNEQSIMKKELRERKLYHLGLLDKKDSLQIELGELIIVDD